MFLAPAVMATLLAPQIASTMVRFRVTGFGLVVLVGALGLGATRVRPETGRTPIMGTVRPRFVGRLPGEVQR